MDAQLRFFRVAQKVFIGTRDQHIIHRRWPVTARDGLRECSFLVAPFARNLTDSRLLPGCRCAFHGGGR